MKTHGKWSIWAKEIPTFGCSEFVPRKPKSKETVNKLEQFVQSEHPRKIARMEPTSSELKQDILNEIIKRKSLSELYMKRNHDKEEDEDDAYNE